VRRLSNFRFLQFSSINFQRGSPRNLLKFSMFAQLSESNWRQFHASRKQLCSPSSWPLRQSASESNRRVFASQTPSWRTICVTDFVDSSADFLPLLWASIWTRDQLADCNLQESIATWKLLHTFYCGSLMDSRERSKVAGRPLDCIDSERDGKLDGSFAIFG